LYSGAEAPDSNFFTRPLMLIAAISSQYGDQMEGAFAADLYLRNLHNYGIAAMLLVLPGVVLAIRGQDSRLRLVAICWVVTVIAMQLIGFREARYLAFLAPLTAMLIVPVVDLVLRQRAAAVLLVILLALDQSRGLSTATQPLVASSDMNVVGFFNAVESNGRIMSSRVLNFVYDAQSPLSRDRYHGIYHLTPSLIERLHSGTATVAEIPDPAELGQAGILDGDRVYYSNNALIRSPPWSDSNEPNDLANYLLVAGDAINVRLQRRDQGFERENNDGSYLLFLPVPSVGAQMPVISSGFIDHGTARRIYGATEGRGYIDAMVVEIKAVCQRDSCSSQ